MSGESQFTAELSKLKGEAPKLMLDPIRHLFSQEGLDSMFRAVRDSKDLSFFDSIQARNALAKLFNKEGTQLPFPSELEQLEKVFGKSFSEAVRDPSMMKKLKELGIEVASIPKSIMSSADMSAPLRQGLFFVSKPKEFFGAMKPMIKGFFSEKAYKETMQEIASRPNSFLYDKAKLDITRIGGAISKREEDFIGAAFAEKIPVLGAGIKASNRGFSVFLNKLRADVFDSIYDSALKAGHDVKSKHFLDSMGKMINAGTGRADLPFFKQSMTELGAILYSPRLLASRIELLNPMFYGSLDPFVRKEALKTLVGTSSILATTLGLANMVPGASVETDSRSSDFAKIKIGNTRMDILGGEGQIIVLMSRLFQNETKSTKTGEIKKLGEGFKPENRKTLVYRFLENKAAPLVSLGKALFEGTDYEGEPIDVKKEVLNRMMPLLVQDLVEVMEEHGILGGALLGVPAFFGASLQSYGSEEGGGIDDIASSLGL